MLQEEQIVQDQCEITAIIHIVLVLQLAQDLASDFKTHRLIINEYTVCLEL